MSNTLFGNKLSDEDQRYVLRAYVHRHTGDHAPGWAKDLGIKPYFKDDQEWLSHAEFKVKKSGRLDMRFNACFTHHE